jgi:hypothetical protein
VPRTSQPEWVVVRHYDDGLTAQIAVDFLRDHGVPVALRGNSGATAVLNRFDTVLDVRLVVQAEHRARALETLSALEDPGMPIESREELAPSSGHPYRDVTALDAGPMPRYKRAAFALALMLPIGAGHFYAGENVAGCVFAASIATLFGSAITTGSQQLFVAAMFVVVCDALTSRSAVDRHNRAEPSDSRSQGLRAAACVAFAVAASMLFHT